MHEQKKKKILLITYSFFPLQSAEALLNAKILSALKNYEIDALTVDFTNLDVSSDYSLQAEIDCHFNNIYRVVPPFWLTKKLFNFAKIFCFF